MGEEKPDEELMGKRKSSPRLSPTPLSAGNTSVAFPNENIRSSGKKYVAGRFGIRLQIRSEKIADRHTRPAPAAGIHDRSREARSCRRARNRRSGRLSAHAGNRRQPTACCPGKRDNSAFSVSQHAFFQPAERLSCQTEYLLALVNPPQIAAVFADKSFVLHYDEGRLSIPIEVPFVHLPDSFVFPQLYHHMDGLPSLSRIFVPIRGAKKLLSTNIKNKERLR